MLKIAIDLTSLYKRKITGLEGYAIDLYKALLTKEKIELYPIFRCKNSIDNNFNSIVIHNSKRLIVEQFLLPAKVAQLDVDVVIYPVIPPGVLTYFFNKNKTLVPVIHDAGIWNHTYALSIKSKIYLKPLYDIALRKASKIVTISETSKEKLRQFTDKKILNFSESISVKYDDVQNIRTNILERFSLTENNFILSVSTIEPRKNLEYLLEIYKLLLSKGFDKKLVLVGRKGWGDNKKLHSLIEELSDYLVFTGYVSNDDLIMLYKTCRAFFLMSKEEGFGRPPLEALACGADVFVSDISIFREVLDGDVTFLPLEDKEKSAEIILQKQIGNNNSVKNKYNFKAFKNRIKPELLVENS